MKHHKRNEDEQWEDIVRRLNGMRDQAAAYPNVDPSDPELLDEAALPQLGPRDYQPTEETVEDFKAPEPRPITSGNPRTVLSWLGVIGAAAIWILAALISWPLPWWLSAVTISSFLGGALSLFFLLPKSWAHRDPYDTDDYGDGAKL